LNRQAITGANNAELHLLDLRPEDSGVYSVMVSNFVDMQWETNAVVTVIEPLELREVAMTPEGVISFRVYGPTGVVFRVERTLGLDGAEDWESVLTNELSQGPFPFVDPRPPSDPKRFYRAVVQPETVE